jgi:putative addiction module component (TIGR02574 family)
MDVQSVFSEVNTWPVTERIRLMEHIWEKLVEEGSPPALTAELKAELDRRCAELDRNPDAVVSWDAVEARAHLRFSK